MICKICGKEIPPDEEIECIDTDHELVQITYHIHRSCDIRLSDRETDD
jgi:hypothetical protein